MNEFFYGGFSVFGEFLFHAVGYDGVDGADPASNQLYKSLEKSISMIVGDFSKFVKLKPAPLM